MSDQPYTIRNINWRETFPFTNLFRTFRIAIHPSKLLLGMVALIILYVGGAVLDGLWSSHCRAKPKELSLYERRSTHGMTAEEFSQQNEEAGRLVQHQYASLLMQFKLFEKFDDATAAAEKSEKLASLKAKIIEERNKSVADIRAAFEKIKPDLKDKEKLSAAEKARDENILQAYTEAGNQYRSAKAIRNEGLFSHFFEYELNQVSSVATGVWQGNWLGTEGVIACVRNFFTVAPMWLLSQHTFFFLLFLVLFMVVWAIFGGAISRIAAVHVARDEKISVRQALRFSIGKLLSFLFAPIIPLLIVLFVGLLITLLALIGNFWGVGPIILGAGFILALVAGFVITLVLLGMAGGFNLMFPTIAVEGSDSFDAISRSFSYLYARPWRLGFYSVLSIGYGAICYLFVRMFIMMMLILTHGFVELGMFRHADSTASLWNTMWPNPGRAGRLVYETDYLTLGFGQDIGAGLVSLWVYLVVALLGAFAISFYFSASTVIYFLMRQEVDATEMDDVYIEQSDEDFAEPTPIKPDSLATEPAVVPSAATSAAPPAEPETPPSTGIAT